MDEQTEFDKAMQADPDNESIHRVYADWLSERGRDDEAEYHRRWTPAVRIAEQWFENMGGEHFNPYDLDNEKAVSGAELIQAGHDYLATGERYCQYGDQSLMDWMYQEDSRREFWANWAIATGITPPEGIEQDGHVFKCSC